MKRKIIDIWILLVLVAITIIVSYRYWAFYTATNQLIETNQEIQLTARNTIDTITSFTQTILCSSVPGYDAIYVNIASSTVSILCVPADVPITKGIKFQLVDGKIIQI